MGLRKGQKELVEQYRGGYCAVPAIPGGGKTHCLSLWAVEMIAGGLHKPGKILIVTYMNSAVNNFKQRIAGELQKRGIQGHKDYFVSTIHSLCLQIIKEKPDRILADEEFEIIDEVNKVHLLNSAVDEWRRRNEDRFRQYLDEAGLSTNKLAETYKNWQEKFCSLMLGAIGDFKTRGIGPREAIRKCSALGDASILKCASEIYELYDRRLKISGFLDFDDMLYQARTLLHEDAVLLKKYRSRYTFVCEDEAQDSNRIQSDILTLIANGNLLRVGDSNQAICGSFSNSDFTLFKSFCELPGTTVYNITQSSRNTREIINLANHFVRYVRESHPVAECRDSLLPQYIEAVADTDDRRNPVTPEYGIRTGIFKSWEEEADVVIRQACHMMAKHPDKSMAILIPSSWRIRFVVDILEARNIPFEQLDNTSKEKNKTVRMLGRIIDFIAQPESGEKLWAMVHDCFLEELQEGKVEEGRTGDEEGGIREEPALELLHRFLVRYPVEKLLYPTGGVVETREIPEELFRTAVWSVFAGKLELIRELLEFPDSVVEKLILHIGEKLGFGREERAIVQKVAGDVRYLMSQDPQWRLSDLALELLSPKNMFNFFAGIVWDLKGYEPKPGVITVSTYHKSKGLEWDVVFLTGLNFADFPVRLSDRFIGEYWFLKPEYRNPKAIAKAELDRLLEDREAGDAILASKLETISEKARLLYVGITRARQYLYLSGFHANEGKRNATPPSQYLLEMKHFVEQESLRFKAQSASKDEKQEGEVPA